MIRVHTATTRARAREFIHYGQQPYHTEEEVEETIAPPPVVPPFSSSSASIPFPPGVNTRPVLKTKLKPKPKPKLKKDAETMTETCAGRIDKGCNTSTVETVSLAVQTEMEMNMNMSTNTNTISPSPSPVGAFAVHLQALEIQQAQHIQDTQQQFRYVLDRLQAIKGDIHVAREGHDQIYRLLQLLQDKGRSASLSRFHHTIRLKEVEERQNQWLLLLCIIIVLLPLTWWLWCWS